MSASRRMHGSRGFYGQFADRQGTMTFFGPDSVESVLRHRGQVIASRGDVRHILLPLEHRDRPLSGEDFLQYVELFGKASFRKLVRRLMRQPRGLTPISELEAIAGESAEDYITFLVRLGVAERGPDGALLTRQVHNIGPSLEWYVAELCRRELRGSAEWFVHLEDLQVGGDYDVLAWLPPTLLYVETKSSAPLDVSDSELLNFLQRSQELAPDMAVLLVDTTDSLADFLSRLNGLMLPLLRMASGISDPDWRPERPFIGSPEDYPSINFGYRGIYVINTKPSITTQLRRCLKHYHARVKGVSFYSGSPINFVTGHVGGAL
jgi:hypothetical protein